MAATEVMNTFHSKWGGKFIECWKIDSLSFVIFLSVVGIGNGKLFCIAVFLYVFLVMNSQVVPDTCIWFSSWGFVVLKISFN